MPDKRAGQQDHVVGRTKVRADGSFRVGRDEELQRAQRFLEAVRTGRRALVIAGEAGVGINSRAELAQRLRHGDPET